MEIKLVLCGLTLWLNLSTPAYADLVSLQASVFETLPPWGSGELITRDQRLELASASLAYWSEFGQLIPRPSPAELDWIETEIASNQDERLGRAINSIPYALKQLSDRASFCVSTLDQIIDSLERPEQYEFEMFYWVRFLRCHDNNSQALQSYIQVAGLSSLFPANYPFVGQDVIASRLVEDVIPAAMIDAMGWELNRE